LPGNEKVDVRNVIFSDRSSLFFSFFPNALNRSHTHAVSPGDALIYHSAP
jgi:hypothetical protein